MSTASIVLLIKYLSLAAYVLFIRMLKINNLWHEFVVGYSGMLSVYFVFIFTLDDSISLSFVGVSAFFIIFGVILLMSIFKKNNVNAIVEFKKITALDKKLIFGVAVFSIYFDAYYFLIKIYGLNSRGPIFLAFIGLSLWLIQFFIRERGTKK